MFNEAINNIYIIHIVVYSFFSISFLNLLSDLLITFTNNKHFNNLLSLYLCGFFLKFTISIISNSIILEKLNKTCSTGYNSKIIFIKSATLSIVISVLDLFWSVIYSFFKIISYKYFILLDFIIINLITYFSIKFVYNIEINNNYICEKISNNKIMYVIELFVLLYIFFFIIFVWKLYYEYKKITKNDQQKSNDFDNSHINLYNYKDSDKEKTNNLNICNEKNVKLNNDLKNCNNKNKDLKIQIDKYKQEIDNNNNSYFF